MLAERAVAEWRKVARRPGGQADEDEEREPHLEHHRERHLAKVLAAAAQRQRDGEEHRRDQEDGVAARHPIGDERAVETADPHGRLDAEQRQIDVIERSVDRRRAHEAGVVLEVVEDDRDQHEREPVAQRLAGERGELDAGARMVAGDRGRTADEVDGDDSGRDQPRKQHRRESQDIVRPEQATDDDERHRAEREQREIRSEKRQKPRGSRKRERRRLRIRDGLGVRARCRGDRGDFHERGPSTSCAELSLAPRFAVRNDRLQNAKRRVARRRVRARCRGRRGSRAPAARRPGRRGASPSSPGDP